MTTNLETKTVAQITELYNAVPGVKPVKKFSSKAEAIKRYLKVAPKQPAKISKPRAKTSVSARCKELIRDGLNNADVWVIVKDEFHLDDSKKYYPAWNRSWMARHGEVVS